ncbi:MAG: hypothetical protein ABW321_35615 [Polyangiales bacterium]
MSLALSALLLAFAAVAFGARRAWVMAAATAVLGGCVCVRAWGWAEGLLVALVLAMSATSLLVLVLPPRAHWARPLALASTVVGIALATWGTLA